MRSLLCKGPLVRLVMLGLVMSMIFGLFGCGSSRTTPEDAARRHLEKTYGGSFVIGELSKKENGPFMTAEYTGYAHEEGRPLERFTVWVSDDCKTVKDARYTVQLLPAINGWVQGLADELWSDAGTAVVADELSFRSEVSYGAEDFREFYRCETVNNTVLLVLSDREGLEEDVIRFQNSLQELMTGYIRIYITDSRDLEALFRETPAVEIMIGSPESVIREKLKDL